MFHRMQAALGGAEKIAAVRDFEETQSAESFDARGNSIGDVRKRTRWISPSYVRIDQTGPGSTYVLYFDGKSGWEILPGSNKAVELEGGELADRDARYKITSPSENVVRISDGDLSHQLEFTLDPKSSLPVNETSLSLSDPSRPMPMAKVFEQWATADGLRLPSRFSVFRADIRVAVAKTLDESKINQGLKLEDLSAKPTDGKPVLSTPSSGGRGRVEGAPQNPRAPPDV